MTTGAFSRNVGKLFSKLKLVTDNLFLQQKQKSFYKLQVIDTGKLYLIHYLGYKCEYDIVFYCWMYDYALLIMQCLYHSQ